MTIVFFGVVNIFGYKNKYIKVKKKKEKKNGFFLWKKAETSAILSSIIHNKKLAKKVIGLSVKSILLFFILASFLNRAYFMLLMR